MLTQPLFDAEEMVQVPRFCPLTAEQLESFSRRISTK
jgi:hypothetical protein